MNFVAVILRVLHVNLLAALNFVNAFKNKKNVWKIKKVKNVKKNLTKIKKAKNVFFTSMILPAIARSITKARSSVVSITPDFYVTSRTTVS